MIRVASARCAACACGLLLLALMLSSCVSPARDDDSYRAKAHQSAKAAASEVATVQLILDLISRNRITAAYSDQVISGSEDAAGSIATTFDSVQPPDSEESDALGDQTAQALAAASDAIRDARIAARRGGAPDMESAAQSLDSAAAALDEVQEASS